VSESQKQFRSVQNGAQLGYGMQANWDTSTGMLSVTGLVIQGFLFQIQYI